MLRLLAESSQNDSKQTLPFSRQQQSPWDIALPAGYAFLPFIFDIVILTCNFLKNVEHNLWLRQRVGFTFLIRVTTGGALKPLIATFLCPLLIDLFDFMLQNTGSTRTLKIF